MLRDPVSKTKQPITNKQEWFKVHFLPFLELICKTMPLWNFLKCRFLEGNNAPHIWPIEWPRCVLPFSLLPSVPFLPHSPILLRNMFFLTRLPLKWFGDCVSLSHMQRNLSGSRGSQAAVIRKAPLPWRLHLKSSLARTKRHLGAVLPSQAAI